MQFYDRFFQTHRTSELTDINLDYKGAIHQLLSSYDALFKYYSYEVRLNSKEYPYKVSPYSSKTFTIAPQIVFISDKIGISSTKNSLRINQQHLFQPYIYLSVFIHEICNFMMYSIMRFLYKNDEVKFNRYSKFFNKLNFPDKQLYNNTDSNFINIKEIVDDISCKNEVKIIISLISAHEDYFSYMYVDILTLSLSFNKNIDQYKYWHINYLLFQANQLHSDIHVISKKNYALIYFRLFMVYYISGNEITENLIENIIKQTPDFYVKQQDINSYKEFLLDVKDAATVIFNEPQLADFFSIIKEVNESVYNDYDFDRNLENDIKYTKENNDELDSFKNRIDEFLLLDINNNEKSYKSKLLDVIRNYIYIFHAYNGYNKNSISIIERDKITGKIIDMGEGKSKLNSFADFCFDSQGGMFTTSSKIRRRFI
jgi:hypothetical protein